MRSSLVAVLLTAFKLASAGDCDNNCGRAVHGRLTIAVDRSPASPGPASADCASYLLTTVSPYPETFTEHETVTSTETVTEPTTISVTQTETTGTVIRPLTIVPARRRARRDETPSAITIIPTATPAYVSDKCTNTGTVTTRYAAACACIGVTAAVTTLPVDPVTITETATVTETETEADVHTTTIVEKVDATATVFKLKKASGSGSIWVGKTGEPLTPNTVGKFVKESSGATFSIASNGNLYSGTQLITTHKLGPGSGIYYGNAISLTPVYPVKLTVADGSLAASGLSGPSDTYSVWKDFIVGNFVILGTPAAFPGSVNAPLVAVPV